MIKKYIISALAFVLTISVSNSFAESSHYQKIDLDVVTTQIVRAELGQMGWFYWMDATACICWIGGKNGSEPFSTASIFDCAKLKYHPKMSELISNCKKEDGATSAAPAAPAPAVKQ